jgi:hypothetical protein
MVATVSCKVKLDNSGLKKVLKACEEFKKNIKVGYINNPDLAYKAAQNEFGGSSVLEDGETIEVPPRPFVQHAIDAFGDEVLNSGNSFLGDGFSLNNVKEKMLSVARTARDAIKVSIEDVQNWSRYPHNSPRTIEQKGFDMPLVDTGAMKDGVEYQIGE